MAKPSDLRNLLDKQKVFVEQFLKTTGYTDRPCYRALSDFSREFLAKTPPGSTVIDFAAGHCLWEPFFADCRYLAFDLGVSNVPARPHWSWVGDVYHTPLRNATADSVICMSTLGHLAYPQRALSEIHRVLKPGGHFLMMSEFGKAGHHEPHDYCRLSDHALQTYLDELGFDILRLEGSNSFLTTIFDLIENCWWKTGFEDLKSPLRWFAGLFMRLSLRFGLIKLLYGLDRGRSLGKNLMPVYFLTLARKK
ncbi:MAG: methyltransferase domain-containing protein [Elusimicrobia bacterium]|nr:methyltransferase domain-containing protein [Elusimicrobiota bacterium]